jgi:hypothetical protein
LAFDIGFLQDVYFMAFGMPAMTLSSQADI